MKLFSENMGGNLHDVTHAINKYCPEIIPGIVHMESRSGHISIVIYRAEEEHPFFVRNQRETE